MSIATKLTSTATHLKEAYEAIEEMGGTVPEDRNFANLAMAIDSIGGGGSSWDPTNPTLDGLKDAIDKGQVIEEGIIIPDDYNGASNPLIVVKYLDGSDSAYQNADGSNVKGVILQRSFITDVGQVWDNSNNNNYGTSAVNTFLNGTYLSQCSSEIQGMVSECNIPVVISSGATKLQCKWFLPSMEEVYGDSSASGGPGAGTEGSYFPYWKTKSGLSTPSNAINSGRSVKANSVSGSNARWWLRSRYSQSSDIAWNVENNGAIYAIYSVDETDNGVLPCCIISQSSSGGGLN